MMIRIGQTAGIVLTLLVMVAASGGASAQSSFTPGFYVAGSGGGSVLTDVEVISNGVKFDVDFDAGFTAGVAAGYRFAKNFRLEAEFSYRQHSVGNVDSLGTPSTNVSGDISAWGGMVNGYLDFGEGKLSPFVGAGIGFANVNIDNAKATDTSGNLLIDDSDTVFAFQAMAGLSYELTEEWSITGEYRFFGTDSISAAGTPDDIEYQTHNFQIGGRYDF